MPRKMDESWGKIHPELEGKVTVFSTNVAVTYLIALTRKF